MATPLHIVQEYPATPAAFYALVVDRDFLQARMAAGGGIDPAVVSISEDTSAGATIVTQQAIPASVLPSIVASMIPGDPITERTETWTVTDDTYTADLSLVVKGAPASLKGTVALTATDTGCQMTVDAMATVPIPMFGGKLESVIVEQISQAMDKEAEYTRSRLG